MRKNLISKLVLTYVAGVLVLATLITGCAQPQPQVTILKYAEFSTQTDCAAQGLIWYLDEVEKRSGGLVRFEKYFAGSLAPGPEILEAVSSGMADVGHLAAFYFPSDLPLHQVANAPEPVAYSTWTRAMAFMELYDRVPEFKAELEKYHVIPLAARGSSGMNLITKKPVRTLADLKGMKIRCFGYAQHVLAALGAVPVSLSWDEIYTGLEKGTVDGSCQDDSAMALLNLFDIAKYHTELHLADTILLLVIREESFDALPGKVQKIMKDIAGEEAITGIHRTYFSCPEAAEAHDYGPTGIWQKKGVEVITLSAADKAELSTVEKQIREKWIAEGAAKGLATQKVAAAFLELCEKWESKVPKDLKGK